MLDTIRRDAFGYAVGVERGFITRAAAAGRGLTALRFFRQSRQGPEPDATRLAVGAEWRSHGDARLEAGERVPSAPLGGV